ncbi:MAG: chromosome condensation protein CrcB [Micromonosporaceae bacterium]|nr:chromosome condensation protein CrcB [Micromonosporaceae bacterium]
MRVSPHAQVLAVIAAGGGLGATARHGMTLAWPTAAGGFPWATFAANALGCALIGVLMVLITEVWAGHRLLRPFLGIGVLGGFTTFSTYAVAVRDLAAAGRPALAGAYLAGTVVAALVATWLGAVAARTLTRRPREA